MNEMPDSKAIPTMTWERQRPDRLMRLFTATSITKWLIVSIAAHVLILGITSLAYIRDRWIDPEGAKDRAAALVATIKAEPAKEAAPDATAAAVPTAQGPKTEAQLLEDHKNAPIVQRITEAAAPEDIPRQPDDLGLSLEDTRR